MPGMKLDFLKNPHQRVATGKTLPLKQVEAIVLYGRPEQRAKVVEKLLPSTYGLALNKQTHHILLTLLDHTDNMARVNMLYNVRRKINDLCTSPVGNVVVQKMIDKVPARQRREIAESFVLNTEVDEFRRLCEHPFGNHVAQKLLEYAECAEVVCPSGLSPFLRELAAHPYGSRVVAKFVESVEGGWKTVLEQLFPGVPTATEDAAGDASPSAFLEEEISTAMDAGVRHLFASMPESMVVSALLRTMMVPQPFKDAIVAHLAEYAAEYLNPQETAGTSAGAGADEDEFALPDFGGAAPPSSAGKTPRPLDGEATSGPRAPSHIHAFCSALEQGDDAQRKLLWDSIATSDDLLDAVVAGKTTVPVAVAAVKYLEGSRAAIYKALFRPQSGDGGKPLTVSDVAEDPVRTLLLRAFLEVDPSRVTKAHAQQLCKDAPRLSKSPVSSPVLQKMLEAGSHEDAAALMYKALHGSLPELISHQSASFLLQSLMQYADDDTRAKLTQSIWDVIGSQLKDTLSYAQGSRVMQKFLAYASDAMIVKVVDQMAESAAEAEASDEDDGDDEDGESSGSEDARQAAAEERSTLSRKDQLAANRKKHYHVRSDAIVAYALHNHACFVVQALLRETRSRQLERERKLLMDALKPHVFDLAVSPWSGRVVLDTMMQSGSAQLKEAMKNVVYLKAESWLSTVSDKQKSRGSGVDAAARGAVKRDRESSGTNSRSGKRSRPS